MSQLVMERTRTQPPAPAGTLWRHRNFLLLWAGQTVSEMGSAVTQLALPLTAVVMLRASTFQVGLLTAAATAAFALIALPAGALVDRWAKRRLMIWCDAARMVIIGSVPLAAALHLLTLGQLYAVAVTAGVCTVFFDVAYQSYLPSCWWPGSSSWTATASSARPSSFAQVAGPGLGGGLVGLVGAARAMAADAISYAVSVASLLAHPRTARCAPAGARPTGPGCGPRSPKASRSCSVTRSCARSPPAPAPRTCSAAWTIALETCLPDPRPAGQARRHRAAHRRGQPGRGGRRHAGGAASRRIGSARIIWFSMLVLGFPRCSSRWPRPAGG